LETTWIDTDFATTQAVEDPSQGKLFEERFRAARLLKRGNGVETWYGTDLSHDRPVIIKIASVDTLSTGAHMRLEHEAGVLRQMSSPWFASPLSLGRDNGSLYLVMPYIHGITLAERLRQGPLPVRETITLGICLMKALQEVHCHGVLHRDLKPANIIIDEGDSIQRATIIDFGLARSNKLDASIREQPVGTARYMSPEQAGLLDQGSDERSDLYSAGVVLFECLAGACPFQGNTVGDVLRQHMTMRPAELRSLGLPVPRALDEVIQRLLRKDPRDRYHSAEAVRSDLEIIQGYLDRGLPDPAFVVGLRDRRKTLTEPAFVGRETELAVLDAQLNRAARGEKSLVVLKAESGGGKTRLLVELAQRTARHGPWVLRGQGLDQTAQRPFQVLVGVAADLLAAARAEPALARTIRERLGHQCEAVCAVFPELAQILGASNRSALGPESFGELRSLQALAALIDCLGSADRPALVVLDDCQWADELTLKLFGHWRRRQDPQGLASHVMVMVAFRSEEVSDEFLFREMQPTLQLTLPAFGPEDVRKLAESMAGPLPAEALSAVERLSEGSPFMAVAALQGMVECGALSAEASGWRVDPLAMAEVQSSRHAAAFLVRRIELLPLHVLRLLTAGAVLGKEFDLNLAATLADQDSSEAIAAFDEARLRHILWAKTNDTRCVFIHDKLRQTLLDRLPPEQRREFHLRVALYLESRASNRVYDLAYHFDAAGQSERALPYALKAAEEARSRHALEIAEQQYRIADRGDSAQDDATRFRIAEGLGDVFMLRGRYEQAAAQFQVALRLARGHLSQATIIGKLGELAFKRGDVKGAGEHFESSLRILGRRVPRWSLTFFLRCLWQVVIQGLHTLWPAAFLGRRKLIDTREEFLAIRLYSRLAHLYWFHRGTVAALWSHLRGLNLAERYPPTPELAQAYSEHAPGMSLIPWFKRGIAYAEKSLVIRRELGDIWGQGQSLHFYGVVLYAGSSFKECIAKCREGIRLLERTGDFWEVNIARFQIAASLYRLGNLAAAVAEAQRLHQAGLDVGDPQASGISLDIWSRASCGRIPPEIIQRELHRPSADVQRYAQLMLAEGVRLIYADFPDRAASVLERALQRLRQAGICNAWVSPVLPWLATALRLQAEKASPFDPRRRADVLKKAYATARKALRMARKYQNELPHALRECGLLCALRGRARRARRYFDEGLEVAQRQGAAYEHARTLQARGQVGREFRWPLADEDLTQAQQTLKTIEQAMLDRSDRQQAASQEPVTLSLVDRFDNVLEAGRSIASALSREAIFAAVRDAALKLLRGERCIILRIESESGEEDVTAVSGEVHAEFSRTMVQKARGLGRAVASIEGAGDNSESVVLSGVRSCLCAPIFVRGRCIGCFYVTHRQVGRLFGEVEEQLADFIATLAGAALENADGFAELRRLNATLENQIAESQRAERRIQEQAALLDKARDAISVQDLDSRIIYWNQSAELLYGWSAGEVHGQKATELLYRGDASRPWEDAERIVQERGEWTGELHQSTKDGKEVIVESRWTLVRDEEGRPKAKLVVNTDITEKKKLEAQFLRAQRMESIGKLAGGIAHDINNVLTPIMMAVELLKADLPTPQRHALLSDLYASAKRGADMVKQILSFARGIDGKRVLLQLRHVILEVEKMCLHTFSKSIDICSTIAGNLWAVNGDATQLYQTLVNLCVNARDAMPQGGRLTISASNVVLKESDLRIHPKARPGPYVLITIEDTGMGIPAEVLDKIFNPFFTTKEHGKGTGLGLSTVLGIVKGHGGFLNVASTENVGTTFSVYLPAVMVEQPKQADVQPAQLPQGEGKLVLVVDDDDPVRVVTQKNLEMNGYRVVAAKNGVEAVKLFTQHREEIKLILMDMMMPGLDGMASIRAIRTIGPNTPIIMASGMALPREQQDDRADYQAFLQKPFAVDRLLNTVDQVLQKS
jgi:PAS domain S-box-containing protein